MSELDYVDALSNKELRAECIKHGLPNVPVTDSSRKLLIRRLRAAIDGPGVAVVKKTSATTRREPVTQAQTQPIEVLEHDLRNRRTYALDTSGGAEPTTKPFSGRTRITPLTVESRRSINSTNSSLQSGALDIPPRSRSVSLSKSDVVTTSYRQERSSALPEAMEVDEDFVNLVDNEEHYDRTRYNYLNAQKPTARLPFEKRTAPRSRSTSLSKSGVVTTSYVQEIVPLAKTPLEEEYAADDVDNNFMDELDYERNLYCKSSAPPSKPPSSIHSFRSPILDSTRYSGLKKITPSPTLHSKTSGNYSVSYEEQQSAEEEDVEISPEEDLNQSSDEQPLQHEGPIYKSKFTRQLAQHHMVDAQPVRRRAATNVVNANDESTVEDTLRQFFAALDRKYNLKPWISLVLGLLLAIFLYVFFIEK